MSSFAERLGSAPETWFIDGFFLGGGKVLEGCGRKLLVSSVLIAINAYSPAANSWCRLDQWGNSGVVAAAGSECLAEHDVYLGQNAVKAHSGGILRFTSENVQVRQEGGRAVLLMSVNTFRTPNPNPNPDLSSIYANNIRVTTDKGWANTRALIVSGGGMVNVSGDAWIERKANSTGGAAIELSNGGGNRLIVGGNLRAEVFIDLASGIPNTLRQYGVSEVHVAGQAILNGAQLGADDPAYQPGGANYKAELGANATLWRSRGSPITRLGSLSLVAYQAAATGYDHEESGGAVSFHVAGDALLKTYARDSVVFKIATSANAANTGVFGFGIPVIPDVQEGNFQVGFGGKSRVVADGVNSTGIWISNDANADGRLTLQLDEGSHVHAGEGGTGVRLLHAGAGSVLMDSSGLVESGGTVLHSTNHQGRMTLINRRSWQVTGADANVAGLVLQAEKSEALTRLENEGQLSAYGIAVQVSGISGGRIELQNKGMIGQRVHGAALIDASGATGEVRLENHGDLLAQADVEGAAGVAYQGGDAADFLKLSDGKVSGNLHSGAGNDVFVGLGGTFYGSLDMGSDDDVGLVASGFDLSNTPRLDGGDGEDELTLQGRSQEAYSDSVDQSGSGVNLLRWEKLNLENSLLALRGDIDLGGPSGLMSVDAGSAVLLGERSSTGGGRNWTVNGGVRNAGVLDLQTTDGRYNTLVLMGDYIGQSGQMLIGTVLDDDASLSDQLHIVGGHASGLTNVVVTQRGGLGAQTLGKGITVVAAKDGATTDVGAFQLQGGFVSAGAFNYQLTRDEDQSWYLRSEYVAPPAPAPAPPPAPAPAPPPAPAPAPPPAPAPAPPPAPAPAPPPAPAPAPPPAPAPAPPPAPVEPDPEPAVPSLPWYSGQTSLVPVASVLSHYMAEQATGSWRERVGGRAYDDVSNESGRGWLRYSTRDGKHDTMRAVSDGAGNAIAQPRFEYDLNQVQVGADVHQWSGPDGQQTVIGLQAGQGKAKASVWHDDPRMRKQEWAGQVRSRSNQVGLYATHIEQDGTYVDGIVQYGRDHHRYEHPELDQTRGNTWTVSAEVGRDYRNGRGLTWTPQAQVQWQRFRTDAVDARDAEIIFGQYNFTENQALSARLGLAGHYAASERHALWGRLDVLHRSSASHRASYRPTSGPGNPHFSADINGTLLQLVIGGDVALTQHLDAFGSASYRQGVSDQGDHGWDAKLGLRMKW